MYPYRDEAMVAALLAEVLHDGSNETSISFSLQARGVDGFGRDTQHFTQCTNAGVPCQLRSFCNGRTANHVAFDVCRFGKPLQYQAQDIQG